MHRIFFSESPLILAQSIALFATWTEYYTRRMKCENLEFHLAFVWPTSNPANRLLMLLGVLSFFSLHMNTSFSSIFIRSRQAKGFISMLFMRLFFSVLFVSSIFSHLIRCYRYTIVIAHHETCTGGTYFGFVEPNALSRTHSHRM